MWTNPAVLNFSGIIVCTAGVPARYALFPLYKNKSVNGQEKKHIFQKYND